MADGAVETNSSCSFLAGCLFRPLWLDDDAGPLLDHGVLGGLEVAQAQFLREVEWLASDWGFFVALLALERQDWLAHYCSLQLEVGHD